MLACNLFRRPGYCRRPRWWAGCVAWCARPTGRWMSSPRTCAATQLARLAKAGVPGADPAGWHGLTPISTSEPLRSGGDVVTLTPSTMQTLNDCPLRWLAERHGGANPRDLRSTIGLGGARADRRAGQERSANCWPSWTGSGSICPSTAQWHSANELARHRAMLEAFIEWRAQTRGELTEVGVEVEVDGTLATEGGGEVRLRGRVDRLERDAAGRLVIVDIKTGKTPVSKDDAQQHAQLAMYQLAVAEGMLARPATQPGGARLVYPGKTGAAGCHRTRTGSADPGRRATNGATVIAQAADATAGPQFIARRNDGCAHCPVRPSCPAHAEQGRQR